MNGFCEILETDNPLFTALLPGNEADYGASDFAFQTATGGRDARLAGHFGLETGDSDGPFQGKGESSEQ